MNGELKKHENAICIFWGVCCLTVPAICLWRGYPFHTGSFSMLPVLVFFGWGAILGLVPAFRPVFLTLARLIPAVPVLGMIALLITWIFRGLIFVLIQNQ